MQGALSVRSCLHALELIGIVGQGRQGGIVAAQRLTQTIATHLSTEDLIIFGRISFWITVYFNRAHILDTLAVNNICSVQQFDAFLGVRRFLFLWAE